MTCLTKLVTSIILVLILGLHQVIAAEAAGSFSEDALSIPSLDENTAIYAGTWVADSEEQAFLLLGNEKVLWLAVATQMEDGAYQLIAQSKPVLSYETYCSGRVVMMDKWDDGRPYFWYYIGNYINYYLLASDETAFPQIEWPIGDNLNLEGFDITIIQRECEDALEYLDEFDKTHSLGEQDDTYKIIWDW